MDGHQGSRGFTRGSEKPLGDSAEDCAGDDQEKHLSKVMEGSPTFPFCSSRELFSDWVFLWASLPFEKSYFPRQKSM